MPAALAELLVQEVVQHAISVRPSTAFLAFNGCFGLASHGSHFLAKFLQAGSFSVAAKGKQIKLGLAFSAQIASSNLQAFEAELSFASKFVAWFLWAPSSFHVASSGVEGSGGNTHNLAQVALVLHTMLHQFKAHEGDALQVHVHCSCTGHHAQIQPRKADCPRSRVTHLWRASSSWKQQPCLHRCSGGLSESLEQQMQVLLFLLVPLLQRSTDCGTVCNIKSKWSFEIVEKFHWSLGPECTRKNQHHLVDICRAPEVACRRIATLSCPHCEISHMLP